MAPTVWIVAIPSTHASFVPALVPLEFQRRMHAWFEFSAGRGEMDPYLGSFQGFQLLGSSKSDP